MQYYLKKMLIDKGYQVKENKWGKLIKSLDGIIWTFVRDEDNKQ